MENRYIPRMTSTHAISMTHVPMCHTCGLTEVAAPFTNDLGEGFCSEECALAAGVDSFDGEESVGGWTDDEISELDADPNYDDFLSQYDDDPSPYDGTYSEE